MSWYKKASEEENDMSEMKEWFEKRTNNHIKLVQKYCKLIAEQYPEFKDLIARGEVHDHSKFENPEMDPYIWIAWDYRCKDKGIKLEIPENIKSRMNKATEHHVKNNAHHPEYHTTQTNNLINRENRDKPPEEMIDAANMNDIDIAEMCADWLAMSDEKKTNPIEWADKNVNVRWKFTDDHKKLIYDILNEFKK